MTARLTGIEQEKGKVVDLMDELKKSLARAREQGKANGE